MKTQNSFIDKIIQNRKVSHTLFWLGFLIVFTILASISTGSIKMHVISHLAMLPSQIIAAYLLSYYQIPKLLLKRKYVLFGVSILLSIYLLSALARFSMVYIAEPFYRKDFDQESLLEILADVGYLFITYFPAVYIYAFIMLIIKSVKNRFEEKHQIEILQKEKATNELKFLRAQIQPHFLFNTLNNLYALTLAKSDVAPKVVLKLSELLDFILYQSNEPTIPIHKEIELIQGFIDLETLRYGSKLDITFNHEVDNNNTQIAPLLLLPLIENAFKHGPNGTEEKARIYINLVTENGKLNFEVFNDKPLVNKINAQKKGIGTINLKRQLELNYLDKYKLSIEDLDENYKVNLHIDLN